MLGQYVQTENQKQSMVANMNPLSGCPPEESSERNMRCETFEHYFGNQNLQLSSTQHSSSKVIIDCELTKGIKAKDQNQMSSCKY